MNRPAFSIRAMQEADWPAFATFAGRNFGGSHPSDFVFNAHWFRRDNSWSVILLERASGGLAGVMMLIRVPAHMLGNSTDLHWISTIFVEQDAQHIGAGGRLLHWAHRSLPLVGSMCGNERSLPLTEALGCDVPDTRMRRFVFLHSPRCYEICDRTKLDAIRAIHFIAAHKAKRGMEMRWSDHLSEDAPELFQRFLQPFAISVVRDSAYLHWRYEQSPYIRYRFLEMRRNGILRGMTVCRFQRTPAGSCNRIVDFAADPDEAPEVWRHCLDAAGTLGALYSDFFVVGTAQDGPLRAAGFHFADDDLEGVPNLLAPVDHRRWSYSFHLGGSLAHASEAWRRPESVWFTKGDGDRDWATPYVIVHGSG